MPEFFNSIISGPMTASVYFICLAAACGCGILTAMAAAFRSRNTKSFLICLVLLPMIVETVIIMVNGNIGTGVAVMGAFSLVRFRSVPGKAKDIASIFLAMTAGLACAAGYVFIALVFTAIVSALMVLLTWLPVGGGQTLELHMTIPETLSFSGAFDDLFAKYTTDCRLIKVKTTNMGSLYKLQYQMRLKDAGKMQEFMDQLRCRNGNLEVAILEAAEGCEQL